MKLEDLTNKKFGRLTVLEIQRTPKGVRWACKCDCGNFTSVISNKLKHGKTKSCGCLRGETIGNMRRTHSAGGTPTYLVWKGLRNRCNNPNEVGYKNYGGRGITYCERWEKYENFVQDMGNKPDGMSIDRIDVNGNYCKENCRWATREQQNNNKRCSINLTYQNQTLTLAQWAVILDIKYSTLYHRIKKLPADKAFVYVNK